VRPWSASSALDLAVDRLVVVAAHPDDETLGAGGLITIAAERDIAVTVVVLTDGLASHPEALSPSVATRRNESVAALSELAPTAAIRFEGLPDGMLREHPTAVRRAIASALDHDDSSSVLLVAPWWGDGHRDHRVVGEIAARFVASGVRVLGYPVWMWHWAAPQSVSNEGWFCLDLDATTLAAKRRAIEHHQTQILPVGAEPPIVHDEMRSHFERDVEVFIDAGSSFDAEGVAPEWFEGFYARHDDPWGFESRWYERRKRDLLMASLPHEHFKKTLELGCATGLLTEQLAERSDEVVAVDVVPLALERARERVSSERVTFGQYRTPSEWPAGEFDLIVLSELAYYWSPAEFASALTKIDESLRADGSLVACHWRPQIEGCALTGDDVHNAITAYGWRRQLLHREKEFVLESWVRAPQGGMDV